jgi:hypothetical protein
MWDACRVLIPLRLRTAKIRDNIYCAPPADKTHGGGMGKEKEDMTNLLCKVGRTREIRPELQKHSRTGGRSTTKQKKRRIWHKMTWRQRRPWKTWRRWRETGHLLRLTELCVGWQHEVAVKLHHEPGHLPREVGVRHLLRLYGTLHQSRWVVYGSELKSL